MVEVIPQGAEGQLEVLERLGFQTNLAYRNYATAGKLSATCIQVSFFPRPGDN